jgi:hypothetical protein
MLRWNRTVHGSPYVPLLVDGFHTFHAHPSVLYLHPLGDQHLKTFWEVCLCMSVSTHHH